MNLRQNIRGNVAIVVALMIPALLGLTAGGVDYYTYSSHKRNLQSLADQASLAAAREAALQGWDAQIARSVAQDMVDTHFAVSEGSNEKSLEGGASYKVHVETDENTGQVSVVIDQDAYPYYVIGYLMDTPQIRVGATAEATGRRNNICVIGLHNSREGTVTLKQDAILTAGTCSVYSNSEAQTAVKAIDDAVVQTALTCSAGGYTGRPYNYKDENGKLGHVPLTDCPQVDDPLQDRSAPRTHLLCNETDLVINSGTQTLRPGVYCNGLGISGDAKVTFMPGVYVIKNGPFIVSGEAAVTGTDVGFYFTGPNAVAEFIDVSTVSFEAPRTGPMAGILMQQDSGSTYFDDDDNALFGLSWNGKLNGSPGNGNGGLVSLTVNTTTNVLNAVANRPLGWGAWPSDLNDFRITSDNAHNLLGTIYLPKADFIVDAKQNVAENSDYTAIVVQRLILKDAPNLYLNTNYDDTEVPVPEGVGPTNPEVRLSN